MPYWRYQVIGGILGFNIEKVVALISINAEHPDDEGPASEDVHDLVARLLESSSEWPGEDLASFLAEEKVSCSST